MKISKQKGTKDIYGEDVRVWQYVEKNIREICNTHSIDEIRTPVFEATELYARGVGDETDIVNKEMYTFLDKGGRSVTLRPELTAGVVRAYIEDGMGSLPSPLKLWYEANMYRYEKMQKGRYREFAQFGVEIFGSASYLADIEAIVVAYELLENIGLKDDVTLNINSIGCKNCRSNYISKLKEYAYPNLSKMCSTCNTRFSKNPLRMLDCKEENCKEILKNAPLITDFLCEDCKSDFEKLKKTLSSLNINYVVDSKIVRGLDYYNKSVFEFISNKYGFAVCAGGRYDGLIESLGGSPTPAVGFGLGMDRVVLLLKEKLDSKILSQNIDIFFVFDDNSYYSKIYELIKALRQENLKIDFDINERSFNANLKYANKIGAKYVCIIGEDEIKNNSCVLKNMTQGTQEKIPLLAGKILEKIK